ncbi:uncharacterized protein LOC110936658 [Helianthus annuus]|uniref:uncharacterized protein LOC110936658 n=1 Tax=Helianthus annuus TaxID=4232 RepID=UPI000B8F6D34|nr:uncharacterized protein LOC110936658 [Helianthus annuus]XP_022034765.2 uncharacterized protein LOC110936658 [Helianthus annuus]
MDPFNNPDNPNTPNNPTQPNVFSVPGYYPTLEPNQFSQYSSNAFASFQHSPNQFAQISQNQALQQMMMRGAWNFPPVQPQPIPTPPVQPQPIPTQSEPEDDVEIVPETQPPKGKGKRNKGKQVVGDQPSKPKATKWTPIEEEALAKAFIGTSDNPTKGNNQSGEGFWSKVLAKFLVLRDQGPYRDVDSVSSKWRKMNSSINRFCEEYNKLYTSDRRSGWNDEDVFKNGVGKV